MGHMGYIELMGKLWSPRMRIVVLSLGFYGVALVLPSYTFVTPDRRIDTHQFGIQSLLMPPIGIAYVVNGLYALMIVSQFSKETLRSVRVTLSIFLSILMGLTMFGFSFGDPEPGSIVRFGPGAWIWVAAILTAMRAGFAKDVGRVA